MCIGSSIVLLLTLIGQKTVLFYIQPSYPPSWAVLLFRASQCGGLPSSLSGSVPAIIWTRCGLWQGKYVCVVFIWVVLVVESIMVNKHKAGMSTIGKPATLTPTICARLTQFMFGLIHWCWIDSINYFTSYGTIAYIGPGIKMNYLYLVVRRWS